MREGGRKKRREGEKEGGREEDVDMTRAKNEEKKTTGQRVPKEK